MLVREIKKQEAYGSTSYACANSVPEQQSLCLHNCLQACLLRRNAVGGTLSRYREDLDESIKEVGEMGSFCIPEGIVIAIATAINEDL